MSDVIAEIRKQAFEDTSTEFQSDDGGSIAKEKQIFALRILSNATHRFTDRCVYLAKSMDSLPTTLLMSGSSRESACHALRGEIETLIQKTAAPSAVPFDMTILQASNKVLKTRQSKLSDPTEKITNPELYQIYVSRILKMRKMLISMQSMKGHIESDLVRGDDEWGTGPFQTDFKEHVSQIVRSYVDKAHNAMTHRFEALQITENETTVPFERTLQEIQYHHGVIERIIMNLTIIRAGLRVMEPFLDFHNRLAGTLGVPVWHGPDEEWRSTKVNKILKEHRWTRMGSVSGEAFDESEPSETYDEDEEPFRLNSLHTYLVRDPQVVAKDFAQAMDEARKFIQVLAAKLKGKKKRGCKTGDEKKVEYVIVDKDAIKKYLMDRNGRGDTLSPTAPFPMIYKPPQPLGLELELERMS